VGDVLTKYTADMMKRSNTIASLHFAMIGSQISLQQNSLFKEEDYSKFDNSFKFVLIVSKTGLKFKPEIPLAVIKLHN